MLPYSQALESILQHAVSFGHEIISIEDAYNRVLAEDVYADRDYPPFNRSAMDGYAVLSSDFSSGNTVELKVIDKVYAGMVSTQVVKPGACIKIMTGAPVPAGADAVVRDEDASENNGVATLKPGELTPFMNIAKKGEDVSEGVIILKKGVLLNALNISALAVVGKSTVVVEKHPVVVIISTGNEVVPVGVPAMPYQIRDSNSYSLKNFFKQYEIKSVQSHRIPDEKDSMKSALIPLLSNDILLLSGGVSKGDADYVPEVLKSLGVKEIFHRVQIKPGAPLWFGIKSNGGVVFGLPGNPVAVQVAFKIFVEPFLRKSFGLEHLKPLMLPLFENKKKKTKLQEFFPCKIINKNGVSGLVPLRMNGSGDIAATVSSDGIAIHTSEVGDLNESEIVEFYTWK